MKSQAEKEEIERLNRVKAKNQMNETLAKQLEQKQYQNYLQKEQSKREAETVQKQAEELKQEELTKQNQRRLQQNSYREFLGSQVMVNNDIKESQYRLSEPERKMNKLAFQAYEESPRTQFSRNAQNMLKSSSNTNLGNLHKDSNFKQLLEIQLSPRMERNKSMSSFTPDLKAAGKPAGNATRNPFLDRNF